RYQVLRGELADPGGPVSQRGPGARAMAGPGAGAEQVVARPTGEERTAPGGVVAGVCDVLARDPHVVAVHRGGAVVAPTGPRRVADLGLVAAEAVIRGLSGPTGHDRPRADTGQRVDRGVRGARVGGITGVGEGHHPTPARCDPDRRVGEV